MAPSAAAAIRLLRLSTQSLHTCSGIGQCTPNSVPIYAAATGQLRLSSFSCAQAHSWPIMGLLQIPAIVARLQPVVWQLSSVLA
eukprot:1150855-Pelagomonas_calceolata.AAC.5